MRIPPEEIVEHTHNDAPFQAYSAKEIADRLLPELPKGFEVHATTHYLIVHNTSRAYAQWCGALFERLYMAFRNYWTKRGFDLSEPQFPLVAAVFADRAAYLKHSRGELGGGAESVIAYFSLDTNRMTMYDLTGTERGGRAGAAAARRRSTRSSPGPRPS